MGFAKPIEQYLFGNLLTEIQVIMYLKDIIRGRFDMGNFTFEEMNLMCIYNTGSRTGLIDSLREMRGELSPEETELRELTDSALCKLQTMTDDEFAELELYPDFD